jgi:DNA-binding response OmpR family regulator
VALPVVVVTARPVETNRALALEQGAVAFLQKPVRTPELLAALRKALRQTEPVACFAD